MSEQFDLLFKNGLLITGSGIQRADLGVRGEKITAIAPDLPVENARRVIDARGKYIFPGTIDVHVHPVYEDNVEDCSRIAAYGGTTSVLHFAYAKQGDSLLQKVTEMIEDGQAHSLLDFGVHGGIWEAAVQVPEIVETMKLGVTTFKFFMTYLKQGWYTDDYQLIKAMDILAEHGGMAMVHAENGGGIDYLEDKYLKGPNAHARYFNTSRPAAFEEEAIFRAARLAEVFKTPLYIPHVTAARAVRAIRLAMEDGLRIFGETCPQYLTLTQKIIDERGALAKIGPPIRTQEDQDALWQGLKDGILNVVASDHAAKKKDVNGDFLMQGFGSPQVETLMPITYDAAINTGRLSLVRLAQVLSENPARIFGLYPRKGTLQVGSDADIVVYDPCREYTITAENQHSKVGYTLYENRKVLGWPEMSFQRGRPVLENGEIVAEPGCGQFMPTTGERLDPVVV
ncbi:MAG TPA: amidohydrolase family protein [Chloroflexi bacterium]|jgi:dihydropyrimidinase|nr:amidohydrolase family protein [Chloroflexota bacterium]